MVLDVTLHVGFEVQLSESGISRTFINGSTRNPKGFSCWVKPNTLELGLVSTFVSQCVSL